MGKVYGVPCYQFLGGKYRDKVRIYADTPSPDGDQPGGLRRAGDGPQEMGLTFIKFDLGLHCWKGSRARPSARRPCSRISRGWGGRAPGPGWWLSP